MCINEDKHSSWWRGKREGGKKHNFGVKRSWEQRTFLNFKKQTPVDRSSIPDGKINKIPGKDEEQTLEWSKRMD